MLRLFPPFIFVTLMAALMAAALLPAMALAQEAGFAPVVVPWGAWVADIATGLVGHSATIVAVGLAFGFRALPGELVGWARMTRVEQILQRAVEYGLNTVAGAARSKTLEFDTGQAVVNAALVYVIQHGPQWLAQWSGGLEMLAQKIWARLKVQIEADQTPDFSLLAARAQKLATTGAA